jgi:autotransporter-associated beta strand protein
MKASTVRRIQLAIGGVILLGGTAALANHPAFPGAEGYGANSFNLAPGANYDVYRVTTLYDGPNAQNMVGTLRNAVRESGFPANGRIVVFDVGGTIQLTGSLDIKNVNNLYIAGQTAPSPITIYGESAKITSSSGKITQNVVLRYLTFRKGTGNGQDAFGFEGSGLGTNLILDHVSASWAEDENLSVANNNTNVTVQYSIISDALTNNHAYGSLIRPRIESNVTFHHNLYANNASRNPRTGTYNGELLSFDFVNNVVYNSRDRSGYAGGSSESQREFVDMNYVGNYVIAGPATVANANRAFIVDKNVSLRAYQSGNMIDSDRGFNPDGQPNGVDTGWGMFSVVAPINPQGTLEQMAGRFGMPQVKTQSANNAYWQVINHAGNSWSDRDAIDARVINNVLTNTGPVVGAAGPIAAELEGVLNAPETTRPAGWDTDGDGMPDWWEAAHGLNPNVKDHHLDFDNNGYTNLEQYINELGAFPAPGPIGWTGGESRYALNGNWDTWLPSRFDTVNINAGRAIVDAPGQHAGVLRIGADSGSNGVLELVSVGGKMSWLSVADSVRIGSAAGQGTLLLNGGMLHVGNSMELNENGVVVLGGGSINLNDGAAVFNWNGGTIRIGAAQMVNLPATIGTSGGIIDTNGHSITYSGALSGEGELIKTGAGMLRLTGQNSHSGGVSIEEGGVIAASPGALGSGAVAAGSGMLVIESGAAVYANNQVIGGLTIGAGGIVDVTTNLIEITYAGDSPFEALKAAVKNGLHDTEGAKIITTAEDSGVAVGIVDDGSRVRVGYTASGDANLDGQVAIGDLGIVAANWQQSDRSWQHGDFNYDGMVDIADLGILAGNWQVDVSGMTFDQALALFDVFAGVQIPETTMSGVCLAGLVLMRRRFARRERTGAIDA